MADIKEAIRRLIYQYTVEGADKVMATQEAVAASTSKTDKASLSLEKSFASIERRYVDTVRAQQDYQKVQEKVNAAVAQNPALQERANVVLAQAGQHFESIASGAGKGSVAAAALARTLTRTIGPVALIAAAVAALSSAFEFFEPIAVRAATAIYNSFSRAFPAVGNFGEGIAKAAKEFIEIEQIRQKSEAVAAALNGVASAAQRAALNIKSMNEQKVNDRLAAEAAQAQERAAETLRLLGEEYPGVTLETAKQLSLNKDLLAIAEARTDQAKLEAEEDAEINRLLLEGKTIDDAWLLAGDKRKNAQQELNNEASKLPPELDKAGDAIERNVRHTNGWIVSLRTVVSMADAIENRLSMLNTQFGNQKFEVTGLFQSDFIKKAMESAYGAANVKQVYIPGYGYSFQHTIAQDPLYKVPAINQPRDTSDYIGSLDVSSPAAIQQSFGNVLALGFKDGLAPLNRLIDVISDPAAQANLIAQAIDYIQTTQPPSLAREEMIIDLNDKLEQLATSTDSLNSTMQNALSPFYSQDPRTTRLGFRAGVVGNPDWMVGGATNQNPLAAILGPGATAPGMAGGGSFVVGGGYSANDNKIAAFPVASGEEVVVNRNRQQGSRAQVINIDNRIIVTGSIDADTMSKLKVSKYQQAQRMRAGLAAA